MVDIHALLVKHDPSRRLSKSYKTVASLGRGGFGSVYRVQYMPTGEERAVKVVSKPKDSHSMQRVVVEVELLIDLDHPNIEKFFEFFEDRRHICLVTELCTGGNLGSVSPQKDAAEIPLLFRDVVSAVAYCHSKGVVHRDIKFDNCLLTKPDSTCPRRYAKVIDFGLSAVRPTDEQHDRWMHEAVGTLYFVAPEVLMSDGAWPHRYSEKCDCWSIGVMMYIVYTDLHPFARSHASGKTIAHRIRRDPVRIEALDEFGLSAETRDLIVSLLKKAPEDRITAEAALQHNYFVDAANTQGRSCSPSGTASPHTMRRMFSQVLSFARSSRFERAVLTITAHDAQFQEVEQLRAAFIKLDPARHGWLSRDGIRTALRNLNLRLPEEEFEQIFEALDPDGDDRIQYTDWLAATIRPAVLTSEKALKELFDFFDVHGNGKIKRTDLLDVLGDGVQDAQLPPGLRAEDEGDLGWEEFQSLMRKVAGGLQAKADGAMAEAELEAEKTSWSSTYRNVADRVSKSLWWDVGGKKAQTMQQQQPQAERSMSVP